MLFKSAFASVLALAAGALASPAATRDYSLKIAKSSSTVQDAFDASFSGRSSDSQFSISVRDNAGTVTSNGVTTNVVVSQQIPWSPYTLYALMGVNSKAVVVGWVYCEGDSLVDLWLEDTLGAAGFTSSTVTGSCSASGSSKNVPFTTPAETLNVKLPASYPTMDGGASLSLTNNGPGSVQLNGKPYDLAPFTIVDCLSCNASTVDGGWMEVHSVMAAKQSSNVCLGIFYLPLKHTATIALDYVNCFTENVGDQTFRATYNIPSKKTMSASSKVMSAPHLPH